MDRRRVITAAALDVVCVVAFVALGRSSHDEGSALVGTIEVAAPFLIALAVGWVALQAWKRPDSVERTGIPLWLITVTLGMVLRHFVFDRGTALPFIIVATLMLGALLAGRRAAVDKWRSVTIARHERVGSPSGIDR